MPEDAYPSLSSWQPLPSVRLGILGCGSSRQRFGPVLRSTPGLDVVALADPDTRSVRAWARELGGTISLFADLPALLNSDAPPNALLVTVPLQDRAAVLLSAAACCKAILCDPPFAPTLEATDALLQSLTEAGVLLLPILPRRFDPLFQQAGLWEQNEMTGALYQVRCEWSYPTHRTFATEIGGEAETGHWNRLLETVACQTADVARGWLGDAISVSADILPPEILTMPDPSKGKPGAVSELANIIVTHARGHSSHHFTHTRSVLSAERYLLSGAQGRLELIASAGSRASTATSVPSLFLHQNSSHTQVLPSEEREAAPIEQIRARRLLNHFSEAARGVSTPLLTGSDVRAAQEIVHAAYLSSQEGRKVTLPLRRSPLLP